MAKRISPLFLIFCYFLFPAYDPGESYHYPIEGNYALSGTFGELRPNHFHSGIDIKTYNKTGYKIYATDEGYLYRVKLSPYSYGKALYLRHPDGRFSVYGHLSGFIPEIEAFVQERQIKNEQFEQEIYLEKNRFSFKKGEVIGYSGNSGSSFGPHLHFELRDPSERIINALPYFKPLVKDEVKPILRKIAFEPLAPHSRVNGKYEKLLLSPSGKDGEYTLTNPILLQGKVGLEYAAIDKLSAASNPCGINYARLYLDEKLLFSLVLDVFDFDESHNINMHIDYAHYKEKGERLQKAYIDEGNHFSAYGQVRNKGILELSDDKLHNLRLELKDSHGNTSVLHAQVQRGNSLKSALSTSTKSKAVALEASVKRNVLVIEAQNAPLLENGMLYCERKFGKPVSLTAAYEDKGLATFLFPLDEGNYPEYIRDASGRHSLQTHLKGHVAAGRNGLVEFQEVQAFFPHDALFQALHLAIAEVPAPAGAFSKAYQIGDEHIPLRESFWVSFQQSWPEELAEHLVIAKLSPKGWRYSGNKLGEDGRLYSKSGDFGIFCVMPDSTAPQLKAVNFQDGGTIPATTYSLHLRLEDSFSGIDSKSIRATLDGVWVPFEYNFKTDQISSRMQKRPEKGRHVLEVEARDGAGNLVKQRYELLF